MASIAITASFEGADVDGLDRLAQEFNQAAQIVNEVKLACEVIVAAASIFGPFGAAFVAYLKGVVIPWLTRIAEALQLMAKVLSVHSQAQKDASSSATSLPSYRSPGNLPTTSTGNYPVLPSTVGTGGGAGGATGASPVGSAGRGGSTVSAPPAIGGTPAGTGTGGAGAGGIGPGAAASSDPTVQTVNALTNLVNAINHTGTPPAGGGSNIGGTLPGTLPSTPGPTAGTLPGTVPSAGSVPGLSPLPPGVTATPLHPGDTVGMLSVPVEISPTGQITPLLHTAAPIATPIAAPHTVAPAPAQPFAAPASHAAVPNEFGTGSLGGGGTSGGGGSGGGFGGAAPTSPIPVSHATIGGPAHPAAAAHAAVTTAATQPLAAGGPGASHDGLYSGLGQATGIGAGAAALARATLHEARQRGEGGLIGAITLPFDAASDGVVQARIYDGELA